MHNDGYISRIIYRCIIGTATVEERKVLEEWMEGDLSRKTFINRVTNVKVIEDEIYMRRIVNYQKAANDMARRIKSRNKPQTARNVIKAAAVVLMVLTVGIVYYILNGHDTDSKQPSTTLAHNDKILDLDNLHAGTSKAIIIDSNGKKEFLTASESGRSISTYLDYPHDKSREMSLEVPRGAEFKVVLEDSTEVWLNAESSIRYPELFGDNERVVSITGEAYFNVKEDHDRPFYVETDRQVIKVYGTSFNVRAYPDEDYTLTTLESGSISLKNLSNNSGEVILSVGHQASLDNHKGELSLRVVDPESVTSWRHGRFVFDDQTLDRIMRDLGRWYDFEYEFTQESLMSREFMGSIHRYDDFRTAIQILENCGDIKFSVSKDNKVLIMPAIH